MRDGSHGSPTRDGVGAHDPRTVPELARRSRTTVGADPGRTRGVAPADAARAVAADEGAPTTTTGTTIVGLRAEEGVVLAADRRASLGGRFVSNKDAEKIERVHPTGAVALSGGVGAIQAFARQLRAEANLYEARRGDPMTMEALSTAAGNAVRGLPAQALLGGVTPEGAGPDAGTPALYELDGSGSVMPTEYAAGGSGIQTAYGVLEGAVEDDPPSIDDAKPQAARAVEAASERDTASGNGLTLSVLTVNDVLMTTHDDPTEVL